jgi:hypothetical protein
MSSAALGVSVDSENKFGGNFEKQFLAPNFKEIVCTLLFVCVSRKNVQNPLLKSIPPGICSMLKLLFILVFLRIQSVSIYLVILYCLNVNK